MEMSFSSAVVILVLLRGIEAFVRQLARRLTRDR